MLSSRVIIAWIALYSTQSAVALSAVALSAVALSAVAQSAVTQPRIVLESPLPYQVIQRSLDSRWEPTDASKVADRSTTKNDVHHGVGMVPVSGRISVGFGSQWEWRAVLLDDGAGESTDWANCEVRIAESQMSAAICLAAGGWYRIELRARTGDRIEAQASVEPVGVGEIFVVSGQSYATNCNDQQLKVQDKSGRVAALDLKTGKWSVAHDPQPAADGSDGGSIWPAFGDRLVADLHVPVGLINVAWGGTSSAQWLPGESLHNRLVQAGKAVGNFRAVLWQQGESDVIGKVSTATYVDNLLTIRAKAVDAWKFSPTWFLAKSTLHPTVYNDPEGELRIRKAIDILWELPGFGSGPDTDQLTGENRGGPNSRRHFTEAGQRRAAEMWRDSLHKQLRNVDENCGSRDAQKIIN